MGKCIITKLQSEVSDSNIPKMGVLRIRVNKRNSTSVVSGYFEIALANKSKIVAVPDKGSSLSFVNSSGISIGNSLEVFANTIAGYTLSNDTGYLEIYDKYSLTSLVAGPLTVNVADLVYCKNITNLDLRNTTLDEANRSFGDVTGIIGDSIISDSTVSHNNVTYDISCLPSDRMDFATSGNTYGVTCSSTKRTGENNKAITTKLGAIVFKTTEDARNFIIANAGCYWEDRENPNIEIRILDNPTYLFADDPEVVEAINTLKGKMVWEGTQGKFIINGMLR